MALSLTLLVIAKQPVPGLVKTRLSPALSPQQAADIAAAALADTLDAVLAAPVARRILVLDGSPWPDLPTELEVLPQRGAGLDDRLAHAFTDAYAQTGLPALLVGMDTPQVSAGLLTSAGEALLADGTDAVLGHAADGGWWALGLRRPDEGLLRGVPMSTGHTGKAQAQRLAAAGLSVAELPVLRDIDTVEDLREVAPQLPGSRFADAVGQALGVSTPGALS